MGNRQPNYNHKIGNKSECPICNLQFNRHETYGAVNAHIDQCMTDPQKGKEEAKRRQIEKEYTDEDGGGALNIVIRRDEFGEQKIVTVKDSASALTTNHVREIQAMSSTDAAKLTSTRDKLIWFRHQVDKNTKDFTQGYSELRINRENLIQDSMKHFSDLSDLRKEIKITFVNELSKDAGGLSREFFTTLMKELLNSNLGLFTVANTPEFSYKINEDSKYIDNHRSLFFFFGKVLGKALFDNIPINVCLNKSVFKTLLGQTQENHYAELEEFKSIDYNVYNSLKFFRDNMLKDHEDVIEQYFTSDVASNIALSSEDNTVELIPGGSAIRVDDSNKTDFITKKCFFVGYQCVSEQLQSLQEGFKKVIPLNWVQVFTIDELEAAICGDSHIDLEDWKKYTVLKGYGSWSQTMARFWKVMETYSQVELSRILQFCTGTSRLPLGGFRSLESHRGEKAKFTIQKVEYGSGGPLGNLPRAHTCFNRLDLPRYPSFNDLKQAMDYIAKNDIVGFGLEE